MDSYEVIDKLNIMKGALMARGWGKTRLEHDDGRICLLGARNIAVYGSTLQEESDNGAPEGFGKDEITNVLIEALINRPELREGILDTEFNEPDSTTHVWRYNDDNSVEFNDVIDLIDEAIINQKDKL